VTAWLAAIHAGNLDGPLLSRPSRRARAAHRADPVARRLLRTTPAMNVVVELQDGIPVSVGAAADTPAIILTASPLPRQTFEETPPRHAQEFTRGHTPPVRAQRPPRGLRRSSPRTRRWSRPCTASPPADRAFAAAGEDDDVPGQLVDRLLQAVDGTAFLAAGDLGVGDDPAEPVIALLLAGEHQQV
jgi:hypothetical protein